MMRLNKYIASCGICSRRKADELISSGKIEVNGIKINELGTKIDPDKDIILYQSVPVSRPENKEYYILNKPTEVICTCEDTHGRKTILDIIKTDNRLYPVGRLDYESSGLLIVTNDGDLTNKITHPSFEIEKEYVVVVKGLISKESIKKLESGVFIDGKKTSRAVVKKMSGYKNFSKLSFVIHEGRNRQIRKMVEIVGSHVYELERVRLGKLTLKGLKIGEYRKLTEHEIKYLLNS